MANFCCNARKCVSDNMNETIAYKSLQGPIEHFTSIELHKRKVNMKLADQLLRDLPFCH